MDFIRQIDNLLPKIEKSKTVNDLDQHIHDCKIICQEYFLPESDLMRQLDRITTEPKGAYFPEMYEKIRKESIPNVKSSLLRFIEQAKYEFDKGVINKPFEDVIKHDESQFLEFKSTLCWDVDNKKVDKKKMGEIIMKSISAFSNSEGGVLLIGVRDDKKILGLSNDYKVFRTDKGSRDEFERHLTQLIINNFSKTFAKDNISIEFPKEGSKEVCLIRIRKCDTPHVIKITDKSGQQKPKFFIRIKSSSREIDDILEIAKYIKIRFPNW